MSAFDTPNMLEDTHSTLRVPVNGKLINNGKKKAPLRWTRKEPELPERLRSRIPVGSAVMGISGEEQLRLLQVISEGRSVTRHAELFWWLQGAFQSLLPHDVMVAAWGDFSVWNLSLDVISAVPGARTEWIARCDRIRSCTLNSTLSMLYSRWCRGGRKPFVARLAKDFSNGCAAACPMMKVLNSMRYVLAHGVQDERGGQDSVYLVFSSRVIPDAGESRMTKAGDFLIPQVDLALRKIYPLPNARLTAMAKRGGEAVGLTAREREIIDWIARGKMNAEIAARLHISIYTVKNHLRRIFRKLRASNRADAIMKFQNVRI